MGSAPNLMLVNGSWDYFTTLLYGTEKVKATVTKTNTKTTANLMRPNQSHGLVTSSNV